MKYFIILLVLISGAASAAPITVLPINSFTAEFLSETPTGMDISITTNHDGSVSTVRGIDYLGNISFSLNGQYIGAPFVIDFLVTFDFGENIGPVTFTDTFSISQSHHPSPDFDGGRFAYFGGPHAGFDFGSTGFAVIGQPGPYDNNTFFQSNGFETGIFYNLSVFTPDTSPVPIPAAVWLFGSGLIGLVGLAMRKRDKVINTQGTIMFLFCKNHI